MILRKIYLHLKAPRFDLHGATGTEGGASRTVVQGTRTEARSPEVRPSILYEHPLAHIAQHPPEAPTARYRSKAPI
jgi:hypothetical protein